MWRRGPFSIICPVSESRTAWPPSRVEKLAVPQKALNRRLGHDHLIGPHIRRCTILDHFLSTAIGALVLLLTTYPAMSTSPPPTVSRGDLTLQPSYFTSSLFVNPLREDVAHLVQLYADKYLASDFSKPFMLFKSLWEEQGWIWFHLKVFDARARDMFITVTHRVFAGEHREHPTDPNLMDPSRVLY